MLTSGFSLAAGLWLAAASVSDVTTKPPGVEIVGGAQTVDGEFDPVVAILAHQGLCTGTVVSETIVLTAGHCLAGLDFGQEVWVFWGPELSQNRRVRAVRWGVHPEFCSDCKEDIFDYGFVEIEAEFTGIEFMRPIATQVEWDETMRAGAEVILVGYGEDPDNGSVDAGLGIKRQVATEISKFSDGELEFFAGGDDRDSCQGDSGGPAFVRVADGTFRLAGITSRGSDPCGDGGYYGTPYPALCWLADETGVDLRADGCGTCDCLDTSQPGDDGNCRVYVNAPSAPAAWLWVGLFAAGVTRRRRSRSRLLRRRPRNRPRDGASAR